MKLYAEYDYNKKDNQISMMFFGFCAIVGFIALGFFLGKGL
jgi:hypothetical protein